MEPDGFIELRGSISGSEQFVNFLSKSGDSMDETNHRSRSYAGLENRYSHQLDLEEVSLSSGGSPGASPGANSSSEGSSGLARSKSKKEGTLRTKRGGKALKIMVTSPKEEEQRRKALYLESIAGNTPLYPLDLQELSADSGQEEEESDRSSVFSPEVAANGFGSPIELPSRDNFEDLLNRRAEAERRMQVMTAADDLIKDHRENGSLEDIPLRSKVDPLTDSQAHKYYDDEISPVEENVSPASRSLTSFILKTLILILVWYIFSTFLTLYNKLLLGIDKGHFPAPLLMNTIHFLMQAVISTVIIRFIKPSLLPTFNMSWKDYFLRVVPTAVATALDINLTNMSLVFISVTFETMCKSGAPVFLLLFAFAFKLEVPSYKLLGVMLIIASGVMLTVVKETQLNVVGFIFVMAASIMTGFRWTVTQLLLQKEEYGLNNPFAVMSYLTPVMTALSLILSLILEPWSKFGESHYFDTPRHVMSSCALMLLGGALAFCMVSAEYLLISETSAVAFTVAGVFKEVVMVLVAVIFLHEEFTVLKGVGLTIIIVGVSLFNWLRYQKLAQGDSGEHGSSNRVGNHKYVALTESNAVFELGDDLEDDIL
ncbi:solute carrier family 35, member C2 [Marchantia polymorpha subsp. ruderalis]|uniref:Sugar phosphate transporter domain-containing protein n=2 Tax=Marchantia polymorpha TaxID=3197 RepID=A0AAF6BTF6_MARPO|nr:hypothetical protein MARPO_0038s0060 [Marchantia polymorpha]BBN15290.1 hypothetical protein Mp_6g18500 [Marchantia polymorpha subsp. ruderalis]|eukprot:PTQ40723.1 hypothetical protein MARPO_0038s0060 [Marchantia polymorpha]